MRWRLRSGNNRGRSRRRGRSRPICVAFERVRITLSRVVGGFEERDCYVEDLNCYTLALHSSVSSDDCIPCLCTVPLL